MSVNIVTKFTNISQVCQDINIVDKKALEHILGHKLKTKYDFRTIY